MRTSLEVGHPAGIPVRIHFTFLLLLVWVAASAWQTEPSASVVLGAVLWIVLVFLIVVLHELGHALMARRFGCQTREIVLLPIGGVARLERIPERPREEFLVAIAGPAVNFALAAIFIALAHALGLSLLPSFDDLAHPPALVVRMVWINVALGTFNLIPAFPMDGGRALRAVLAAGLGRLRATRLAAGLGQGLAAIAGVVGLVGSNPVLLLVGVFIFFGASVERRQVQLEHDLRGVPASDAMVTRFSLLPHTARIDDAVHGLLESFQTEFPVVERGRIIGVLSRPAVLRALAHGDAHAPVRAYMRAEPPVVSATAPLLEAIELSQREDEPTLIVIDGQRVVGLLAASELAEFVQLRQAAAAGRDGGGHGIGELFHHARVDARGTRS